MASMRSIVYSEVCEPRALRHCGSRDYSAVKKRKDYEKDIFVGCNKVSNPSKIMIKNDHSLYNSNLSRKRSFFLKTFKM